MKQAGCTSPVSADLNTERQRLQSNSRILCSRVPCPLQGQGDGDGVKKFAEPVYLTSTLPISAAGTTGGAVGVAENWLARNSTAWSSWMS